MIDTRINKVTAKGNNIFIFQNIDAQGNKTEQKMAFEEFLKPFVEPYTEQITLLKASLEHTQKSLVEKDKIENLLDEKILNLSNTIQDLEQQKAQQAQQVREVLAQLDGKDLQNSDELYQQALQIFITGDVDGALLLIEQANLEEAEQQAQADMAHKAEIRLLNAQMLRMKNQHKKAEYNYRRAVELLPRCGNHLELANYLAFLNDYKEAEKNYQFCLLYAENDEQKATTLNNLANLQSDQNELTSAHSSYDEALAIYRDLARANPQTYLPKVAVTLVNMAIFHQESVVDKQKSIALVDEAIEYLLPLHDIGYIQNYLRSAFMVLRDWDIDVEDYFQQKLKSLSEGNEEE